MSDRIVVGVTDAPAARRAVDWAVARAAERRQRVELLAVVGGAIGVVGEAVLIAAATEAAQQLLDDEVARVKDAGVPITTRVTRGNPVAKLLDA